MKQLIKHAFCITILLLSSPLFSQDNAPVTVSELSDNLYKFTLTTTFSVNMAASIGNDGILLVDTGMPGITEKVKAEKSNDGNLKIFEVNLKKVQE